jgi:hypothetical protein
VIAAATAISTALENAAPVPNAKRLLRMWRSIEPKV